MHNFSWEFDESEDLESSVYHFITAEGNFKVLVSNISALSTKRHQLTG